MSEKVAQTVLLKEGYLTLNSQEAIDWLNEEINLGTLWQSISKLVNDHVSGNDLNAELLKQISVLAEGQKVLSKQLSAQSLPPNNNNTALLESSNEVIDVKEVISKPVERKSAKPSNKGLAGIMGKFNNFK